MGDDHARDEVARMKAEMDQAAEGMKELARGYWSFYSGAVESGFDSAQAMQLTVALLQAHVWNASDGDDE